MKRLICLLLLLSPGVRGDELTDVLRERLDAVERERDQSRRALLDLQARTTPLLDTLQQERDRLQTELEDARRELHQIHSTAETSSSALRRAEEDLAGAVSRVRQLEERIRADQDAFVELLNGLRREKIQVGESAERDLEDARAARQQAEQRLETLTGEMDATRERLEALRAEETALRQERDDIRNLNQRLEEDLADSRRAEELAQAQLNALRTRMDLMREELNQAFSERSQALDEQERLRETVERLRQELRDAREASAPREELERLQNALNQALGDNDRMREELEALRNRPDLTADLERALRQRDLLDAKLKTMETRLAHATDALAREQAERAEAEARAREQLAEWEAREQAERAEAEARAREQLAEWEARDHARATAMDENERALRQLEAERNDLLEEVTRAAEQRARAERLQDTNRGLLDHLAEVERERSSLAEQINLLQQDLEEARAAGVRAEELDEVKEMLDGLERDNLQLVEQLVARDASLEELQATLSSARQGHEKALREMQVMLGQSVRDLARARNEISRLEARGARVNEIEAERAALAVARDRAHRDMRILANHIRQMRQESAERAERERAHQAEREALLERIRALESAAGSP